MKWWFAHKHTHIHTCCYVWIYRQKKKYRNNLSAFCSWWHVSMEHLYIVNLQIRFRFFFSLSLDSLTHIYFVYKINKAVRVCVFALTHITSESEPEQCVYVFFSLFIDAMKPFQLLWFKQTKCFWCMFAVCVCILFIGFFSISTFSLTHLLSSVCQTFWSGNFVVVVVDDEYRTQEME